MNPVSSGLTQSLFWDVALSGITTSAELQSEQRKLTGKVILPKRVCGAMLKRGPVAGSIARWQHVDQVRSTLIPVMLLPDCPVTPPPLGSNCSTPDLSCTYESVECCCGECAPSTLSCLTSNTTGLLEWQSAPGPCTNPTCGESDRQGSGQDEEG